MVSEEESSEFVSEVFPLAFLVFFVQVPNKFEFDFSSDDVEEMVHLALDFPIDSNTLTGKLSWPVFFGGAANRSSRMDYWGVGSEISLWNLKSHGGF